MYICCTFIYSIDVSHYVSCLLSPLVSHSWWYSNFQSILQIRTIMVDNIEKILERGDRIELLVDKTATMQDSAFHFRKQSKRLRRALWMKNFKLLWVKFLSYVTHKKIHFGKYTFCIWDSKNYLDLKSWGWVFWLYVFWSLTGPYWHSWLLLFFI